MKKILLLSVLITTTILSTQAGLKRVGFSGAPIAGVDFTSLIAAHNDAGTLAGDTIQVYPGYAGGGMTQTKRLIIIGIGYLTAGTNANTNLNVLGTQNPINISAITYTNLSSGVSGSEYQGVSLNIALSGNIGTSINNITIQRSRLTNFSQFNNPSGTITNLKIKQCLFVGSANVPSIILQSCLIENTFLTENSFFSNTTHNIASTFYIKNCTSVNNLSVSFFLDFSSCFILAENCFFQCKTIFNYSNTTFVNCFLTDLSQMPLVPAVTGTNNVFNVNADNGNVFVGYPTQGTNSNDGRFMLKAGSPAIGAGTGGVDCGAFGNTNPYKLSGIPATPAFYKLSAPSVNTSTNPYQITFSVRSNN